MASESQCRRGAAAGGRLWCMLLAACVLVLGAGDVLAQVQITNPYGPVDWDGWGHHKANLHTHTTQSDGQETPARMIDAYHELGYTVLALTDHNATTWSWQDYGRDPNALGMIAIQGSEPSRHHHMGSYFNPYNGSSSNLETSLQTVAAGDGLAVMFHPGRYSNTTAWYVDLYQRYDHLVGMEVHNQGDRYPGDRAIWDAVLMELMPDRPVWGYSNDDAHRLSHVGRNWQTLLLPELTEAAVRDAMINGRFYFSYAPTPGGAAPVIHAIEADGQAAQISIDASGYTEIRWIVQGELLAFGGSMLDVSEIRGYVRAELVGPAGITYTQPFYVVPEPASLLLLGVGGMLLLRRRRGGVRLRG